MVHPQKRRRRRSPKIGRRHKKRRISSSSNESPSDTSPIDTSDTSPSIFDSLDSSQDTTFTTTTATTTTTTTSTSSTLSSSSATTTINSLLLEEEDDATLSFSSSKKGPKGMRMNKKERVKIRNAIDTLYTYNYHQKKEELKLTGRGGIVSLIQKDLNLHKNQNGIIIRNILKSQECIKNNIPFDPSSKNPSFPTRRKIKPGSLELQLFTSYHEDGLSYNEIKNVMNTVHFGPKNLPLIGYTAVQNAAIRETNEKITKSKTNQVSDKHGFWKKACYQFSAHQMCIRLALPVPMDKIPEGIEYERNYLIEKNMQLDLHQIAHWDEKHIKQRVGCLTETKTIYPRDANGIYDPVNGVYKEKAAVSVFKNKMMNNKNKSFNLRQTQSVLCRI